MNIRNLLRTIALIILSVFITHAAMAQDFENDLNLPNISKIILTPEEQKWLNEKHLVKIRVGSVPPYQFLTNPPSGISVDYIKLIAEKTGINIQFDTIPYTLFESLQKLKDKNGIDLILSITPKPEREEYIEFTDAYLSSPWVIFNGEHDSFIRGISDLYGKTVSVQKGHSMHRLLEKEYPDLKLLVAKDTEAAIEAVSTKKADAFIGNLTLTSYLISQHGISNLKVAALTPFGNHNQAMGIRKDWPELASIITKTLQTLTPKEHSAIFNKWMLANYEQGLELHDVIKFVAIFTFAVLVIVILIIYHSYRKLQNEIRERRKNEIIVEKFFKQPMNIHLILELDGTIRRINNGWINILGYTKEEIEGKYIFDLIHPDDIEMTQKEMVKLGQGEMTSSFENRYLHKDGSYRLFVWSAIASMEDRLVYAVASDITEKKKIELDLKELNEKLQLKVKEEVEKNNKKEKLLFEHKRFADMGLMINAIAHQWRQPLNNISLVSQMMEEIDNGDEFDFDKNELYSQHRDIVEHMSQTIDNFRNYFSRDKEKHNFSIVDEIQSTLSLVDVQFNSHGITTNFNINESGNTQDNEDTFLCYGSPGDFRQVLLNIFNNAHDAIIDYKEKNSNQHSKITITVGCDSTGSHVTIENSGDNIPDDILVRIFQPYFTTKEEGKGTGIGLYMSRIIIEQEMNGKIYAMNTDSGVAFHLLLPKVVKDEKK